MTWRPIETAPRDGTVIWLWAGERLLCQWQEPFPEIEMEGSWRVMASVSDRVALTSRDEVQPTHWQPLPAPPEDE